VIAISGPSGSGKTTLVKQVAAQLGDATALFYDDYRTVSDWTKTCEVGQRQEPTRTST
jgi:uridine kinase